MYQNVQEESKHSADAEDLRGPSIRDSLICCGEHVDEEGTVDGLD